MLFIYLLFLNSFSIHKIYKLEIKTGVNNEIKLLLNKITFYHEIKFKIYLFIFL